MRIRYAKRGRLRFTSHRDIARAFERALRRARVPMAYSQGFSPHPKISWIGAAPTGVASEAEFVEIQLIREVDPADLVSVLDEAMPPGLDVLEAVPAGAGSLAEAVPVSRWRLEFDGVPSEQLRPRLPGRCSPRTGWRSSGSPRTASARSTPGPPWSPPAVVPDSDIPDACGDAAPGEPVPCGILEVVVRQTTPAVRPDDVLSALRVVADLAPPVPAKATRMAQGRLDDSGGLDRPVGPRQGCGAGVGSPAVLQRDGD